MCKWLCLASKNIAHSSLISAIPWTSTLSWSFTLVSLHPRINLSPFTKDFRGEEHYNESIDLFFKSCFTAGQFYQMAIKDKLWRVIMCSAFSSIHRHKLDSNLQYSWPLISTSSLTTFLVIYCKLNSRLDEKYGTLHEFACHPCAGAMLIFSVSFQF